MRTSSEAHASSRIDRQTLGILLFIVSEVMLFGAFFASYFFLRVVANVGPWPPEGFDLPKTVESLESLGIPTVGFETDEFPPFYSRSSGLPVDIAVSNEMEAAEVAVQHWRAGGRTAALFA